MTTTAPYGSWISPISARDLASSAHPVVGGAFVGDETWWLEGRPSEGGRYAVRTERGGAVVDILPAPWNARTRVHEYGGGAWTATDEATLVFAEFSDQRLYRLDPGSTTPIAITPEPREKAGVRFASLAVRGSEVIAVRETHHDGDITRDIVAVALDGSGIRSIVGGSRFLAYPRFSPDGGRLAWIAWEHPQMPWDGTELRVAEIVDGAASHVRVLAGSTTESVLEPQWLDNETLTATTDRSGFWNLVRIDLDGTVDLLHEDRSDFGGPLWSLGSHWYEHLGGGRFLAISTSGTNRLVLLDSATGTTTELAPQLTHVELAAIRGNRVLLVSASSTLASGLRELDLATGAVADIRLSVDAVPEIGYLSPSQARTFPGARDVHAFVYPPHNQDFVAPNGELPPYVAFVHGGPTGHVTGDFSLTIAYFTSRGIGVVDVNYGGSTGYGREYRERLKGEWGIVDVEDTVAAVLGLADAGLADRDRLAIRGGSAGGWTVLAALTATDVFAAGASYFGVGDAMLLATDTHDFESRYLDGLIGPLPEAADLYAARAPINNVDRLSTPVLLLQGLDDPIVTPAQSQTFRDALAAKGLTHAYLEYEGESHGFRKAETIIHATESELSFYGQVMGFTPAGVPKLALD
jgi:dipeptidyl aminopeptidase/acylaminoacyl peptidase